MGKSNINPDADSGKRYNNYKYVMEALNRLYKEGLINIPDPVALEHRVDWLYYRPKTDKKENYADFLKGEAWKKIRGVALAEQGYTCRICGRKEHLQVHHINYNNRENRADRDLAVLCEDCHHKVHSLLSDQRIFDAKVRIEKYKESIKRSLSSLLGESAKFLFSGGLSDDAVSIIVRTINEQNTNGIEIYSQSFLEGFQK